MQPPHTPAHLNAGDGFSTPPEALAALLQRLRLPPPLLDIGCGTGAILHRLQALPSFAPDFPGQMVLGGVEFNPERARAAADGAEAHTAVWPADYRHRGAWHSVPWGTVLSAPPHAVIPLWWANAIQMVRPGGLVAMLVPVVALPSLRPAFTNTIAVPQPIAYGKAPPRFCAWAVAVREEVLWKVR